MVRRLRCRSIQYLFKCPASALRSLPHASRLHSMLRPGSAPAGSAASPTLHALSSGSEAPIRNPSLPPVPIVQSSTPSKPPSDGTRFMNPNAAASSRRSAGYGARTGAVRSSSTGTLSSQQPWLPWVTKISPMPTPSGSCARPLRLDLFLTSPVPAVGRASTAPSLPWERLPYLASTGSAATAGCCKIPSPPCSTGTAGGMSVVAKEITWFGEVTSTPNLPTQTTDHAAHVGRNFRIWLEQQPYVR
jgi:hypothetical protein